MKKTGMLVRLFAAWVSCAEAMGAAQTVNRDWGLPDSAPIVFPDGHSIRVERPVPASNPPPDAKIRVILKQPDGQEILMWNPPAWQPDVTAKGGIGQKLVVLSAPYTASIDDTQVGVVFSESDYFTTWWIRWDLKERALLPIISTNGIGSNAALTLVEPSVLHVKGGVGNFRLVPGPNGQLQEFNGRTGEQSRVWPKRHMAFFDKTTMEFGGEHNGWKVWRSKNSRAWPFNAVVGPEAPAGERVLISSTPPPVRPKPAGGSEAKELAGKGTSGLWFWLLGVVLLGLAAWLLAKRRQ